MSSDSWNFAINSVCYIGILKEVDISLQKALDAPDAIESWKILSSSFRRSSKLIRYLEKVLTQTSAEA